jgi:hypothetical protein
MVKRILLATFAAMLLAMANGSCGGTPYKRIATAHRVLNHTVTLTEAFDRGVAAWARGEHRRCLTAHKAKTKEFGACVMPALKFLRHWTGMVNGKPTGKGVLPAIQSAQKATRLVLDAAFAYVAKHERACSARKGAEKEACDKKGDAWKVALRPGACALIEVVDRGVKVGAYRVAADPTYKLAKAGLSAFAGCK